jgi:hypothetical protein
MNSSNYNLLTFKAISTFVTELAEIFSSKNHSLKLYSRLINKTTLTHDNAIKKNIDAFKKFCVENKDAILNKDEKTFVYPIVEYSSRVFIDFKSIFNSADNETKNAIWKHLLTISALVDPTSKAKEILKNSKDTKEANFLTDILNKVETTVTPNSNPLEAVTSIMSSGVFNDLIAGMNNGVQDGSLDLGKLMGTVQQMCSSLGTNLDMPKNEDGTAPNPMNMINSMMSNLSTQTGGGGGGADLASLLGPMLTSLTNSAASQALPAISESTEESSEK